MFYVGIDIAKYNHEVSLIDTSGKSLADSVSFTNSKTNLSEEGVVALRQLSRYRLALVDSCGDCKRRVIALLDQVFPEYSKFFSDTFGITSKEVLLNYPTPEDMLTVSTDELATLLSNASRGRFKKDKAEKLQALANNTFGVNFAKDAFAFQIRQLIEQLVF